SRRSRRDAASAARVARGAARAKPPRLRANRWISVRPVRVALDACASRPLSCPGPNRRRRARAMGHLVSDFITLFVVVDPLAASSVFRAVTASYTAPAKRRIATLAVLVSLGVQLFFIVLGQIIVGAMGISLRAFQIAGGIVLFLFAASMILSEPKEPTGGGDGAVASLAVYPLAIPAIAGPGTMLTVMLLTANDRFGMTDQAITTGVVAAVLVVQFVLLVLAEQVSRVIGKSGANVLRRIMGMILASVAVNAVLVGIGSLVGLPKP